MKRIWELIFWVIFCEKGKQLSQEELEREAMDDENKEWEGNFYRMLREFDWYPDDDPSQDPPRQKTNEVGGNKSFGSVIEQHLKRLREK